MVSQHAIYLDEIDKQILQILQDDFPLVEEPWKAVAEKLNLTEREVINHLKQLYQQGITRKIGAVIDKSKIGLTAATLVALKVPAERIEQVSEVINQHQGVSHNYERDHEYNVWFTLKASSQNELNLSIKEITEKAAVAAKDILSLPTKNCFKINVRFQIT